ncbi:hypothetical protein L3X38_001765 [Prunus dulcis]|uniref:Uncharacterized protein n=1 Tax=Prunus dulcis TaxID=3755 RepID=A0AAD4ZKM7_PRUDU|nr:hypothetical protein L3X38_001765 [Prunus dulcis]
MGGVTNSLISCQQNVSPPEEIPQFQSQGHVLHVGVTYGSAPTDEDFDPEPDPESGSSFDDPNLDSEDDSDPHSDDDPNPEFVSDLDPDPDFDFDSGPDSGSDSDPNSYSTCILCIFRCTDYDF